MLSETKTSPAEKIPVIIQSVRPDTNDIFEIDTNAVRAIEHRWVDRFRRELVDFATKNKSRRIYVVTVMKIGDGRSSLYYMPFPYENRSIAYETRANLKNANVDIYDFSPIIERPEPPHLDEERKLWEAFNRCCRCDRPRPCKDVTYCGKPARMCEECIEELTSFRTVKKK